MPFAPPLAGLVAALLSSAPVPPGMQPSQVELEAALLAHQVRLAAHPMACRRGLCLKAPKAIKVRAYDCQATGTDPAGGRILYCRVTYVHKGGSLSGVKSPNECVPLRAGIVTESGTGYAWEVALVDHEGKCPGARH